MCVASPGQCLGLLVWLFALTPEPDAEAQSCAAAYRRLDYEMAAESCRAAAERGNADAQMHLAMLYEHGHAMPADLVEAYKWFDLAARSGQGPADDAAWHRDAIAARLAPEELAEAKRLVEAWSPR